MSWYDYEMRDIVCGSRFLNLDGKPIKKTPFSNPYNYDEYVIWKDKSFKEEGRSVTYSDRLYQWDYKKYNKCCQEVFKNKGQYFDRRKSKEIERFLSMYFEKEIKLTAIIQGCNQGNGYPYWVFFYKEN